MRIGFGFDTHRMVSGRKLIIGGIEIPFEKGLLGHSDADVLSHAIADSLLSASNLGDIGQWFPDTDPRYKDISSLEILRIVHQKLNERKMTIVNIDCVVVLENPRISGFIAAMKDRIARTLEIKAEQVFVKGKSMEGLGFIGSGEGASAYSVVLIDEKST